MSDATPQTIAETVTFRLGTLGARLSTRFSEKISKYNLKLKHVGVLTAIRAGAGSSQLELARVMRVVPSVVVANIDELEQLGALKRVRDQNDRRRQNITLTPRGHALLKDCTAAAREVDAEVTTGLDEAQKRALKEILDVISVNEVSLAQGPEASAS